MPKENKGSADKMATKVPVVGYGGMYTLKFIRRDENKDRRVVETIIRDADRGKSEDSSAK